MIAYVDSKSVVRQRVGIFIRLCNDRYSYFLGKQWNKLLLINLKIGSESFFFAERQQPLLHEDSPIRYIKRNDRKEFHS